MKNKRLIEFFIYPDAVGLDIIGPLDVFTVATEILNREDKGKGYKSVFSGEKRGLVKLNSGLTLYADIVINKSASPDIIVIPGGFGTEAVIENQKLLKSIKSQANKARQIVSICTGSFILAACGLLKGKKATTHWLAVDSFSKSFPDTDLNADAIYIRDGRIYTSAGVTAGIDLALSIVEEHHGTDVAMEVARILVLYFRRPGGQSQFSTPMELRAKAGKQFKKLHDWILENIKEQLSVESLADHVAMSPRNFSRLFTKETGITPGKYVELMRLNRARELLELSDVPIKLVAEHTGFLREERLRRVFVRQLGITPAQYQIHFRS
ncbi:MAG: GlxA family transcriptional regulator [Desulfobacterales bacterium]|nr:GlxA family transcriptional regulator [Desulfobacterales bacterium]MCP4164006.1 GlxA family transcriptional regulator [Deltaproteobacteria bacterium]